MNTKALMNFTPLIAFMLALVVTGALRADTVPANTPTAGASSGGVVAQDSAAQDAIQKQSDAVRRGLLQLVQELRQNGLQGSDAAILDTVAAHLSSLDAGDMRKVMEALHGADTARDDAGRQSSLVTAYQEQKTVALQLQALAAELAAEEASSGLTTQLEKLIERQSANLRRTELLTRNGRTARQLDEREQAVHSMTASEQANIGGGIDQALAAVGSVAASPAAGAPADNPAAALGRAVLDVAKTLPLKDTASAATRLSQDGPFSGALAQESALRQELNALLQAALSGQNALTRLEQAQAELERLIGGEKELIATSRQNLTDGDTLAERQFEIDDQSQVALALLRPLNAEAVDKLGEAQQYMVDSAGELSRARNTGDAAKREGLVADTLAEAEKLLAGQIAAAQTAEKNQTPLDALAQAQQVQKEVQQAQRNAAANPGQTADDLKKMQQEAFAVSPEAAAHLAAAADQLEPNVARKDEAPNLNQVPNSEQAPAAPQNPNTPQNPAQAAADLAAANDALQQKIDALTKPAAQAAALAQAQQQIDQAEKTVAQAEKNIQADGPQPAEVPRDLADAAQKATQAQQASQAAGTPAVGTPEAAANAALQQAARELANGGQQAVQGNPAGAKAAAQQGMAALQQAKGALAQAMAQLQGFNQDRAAQNQAPNQGGQSLLGGVAPKNTAGMLAGSGPQGGSAQVVGALSPKDRAAITQYQAEKAPPEYAPLVQQYLKNLADTPHSP